jgi:2-polyprenyl-3-methyl-5-hydroxy-6-metoxy-1,4-benzoquinol methylase
MFLSSLRHRRRLPEIMDDPGLDVASHREALAGLARINRFSGSLGVLWPELLALAKTIPDRPLRVLDVATGSGDVPAALVRKAAKEGVRIEVLGVDVSQVAIAEAEVRAELGQHENMRFQMLDVLQDPLPTGYDAITCSLFLHHLDDADAVGLLKQMKAAAGRLVLVNDLVRSRANYLQVWFASHVLRGGRGIALPLPDAAEMDYVGVPPLGGLVLVLRYEDRLKAELQQTFTHLPSVRNVANRSLECPPQTATRSPTAKSGSALTAAIRASACEGWRPATRRLRP